MLVSNRYQPLTATYYSSIKITAAPPTIRSEARIPPTVIEGKANGIITAHLDLITSGDYRIKATASSTIVHTKNLAD